jgi:hypothetical protein
MIENNWLGGLDYQQETDENPPNTCLFTVLPIPVFAYDR